MGVLLLRRRAEGAARSGEGRVREGPRRGAKDHDRNRGRLRLRQVRRVVVLRGTLPPAVPGQARRETVLLGATAGRVAPELRRLVPFRRRRAKRKAPSETARIVL